MRRRAVQLVIWFVGYLVIGSISAPPAHALLNCTNQQVTSGAEEPHPLRPNPGQECTPDIPPTSRIECGTDIVVVKTIKMPRGGPGCTPFSPTDYGKHIDCTRTATVNDVPVQIGLQDLELPIAGVASNLAISDSISDALKMRNYTSWYKEGGPEQGDQEVLDPNNPLSLERALTYDGPIKKLIAEDVLNTRKEELIDSAKVGESYNQIIGYVDKNTNAVIGRKQARSLLADPVTKDQVEQIRLIGMDAHRNPPWIEGDQEATKWSTLWRQVPWTQTVDLAGEIYATLAHPDNIGMQGVTNATLAFNPSLTVADLSVAFPHLAEDDQLAQLLQSVFIPSDIPQTTNYQLINDYTQNTNFNDINRGAPWATQGCRPFETGETPWNPGDRLESSTTIKGSFSFTKDVTYSFDWWTAAEIAQRTAAGLSLYEPVEVDVSAPLSIFSRTPQALDNVYDRLLNGPGAVFKALYPLNYTPDDRPAAAGLTGVNCGSDCEVWPANEKGRKAEMFFPHLGSILLDWHQKLQCMLDPLGRCGRDLIGARGNSGTGGVCENAGFAVTEKPDLTKSKEQIVGGVANQERIDPSVLMAILTIEAGPNYDPQTDFCAVSACSEAGPFQITTGWEHVNCDTNQCGGATCGNYCTRAQNGEDVGGFFDLPPALSDLESLNRCNFEDALRIAVNLLKVKGGLSRSAYLGATTAYKDNLMKAFMGYHGDTPDSSLSLIDNCKTINPLTRGDLVGKPGLPDWTNKTYCEYSFDLLCSSSIAPTPPLCL